jgi:GNAT superfamily N-acetyltransferase
MTADVVSFREGSPADLQSTFALSERTMHRVAVQQGFLGPADRTEQQIAESWARHRKLVEFLDAQPGRRYVVAEGADGPVGFARVVRFGAMEQLTDLMVHPANQGRGLGRRLLERIWPHGPSPSVGRLVIATGAPRDLTLYTDFGLMPVAGHWHMRQDTAAYLERRSHETDATEAGTAVVLTPDRALGCWNQLEPDAIAQERPALHDFFARDRTCLATVDPQGRAKALCWVSSDGDIGPAVGTKPGEMISVVLAALDRVAKTQQPESLGVYAGTSSWQLIHRLRMLGFGVFWPSWIMCSVPLPALDRYVPTKPPFLL